MPVPTYTTVPPANAVPTVGSPPAGDVNVPVVLYTTTIESFCAFGAKLKLICPAFAAVALNEAGGNSELVFVVTSAVAE